VVVQRKQQQQQQQMLAQKQQQQQLQGQGTAVINQATPVVNQQPQPATDAAPTAAGTGIQQVHGLTQQQGLIVLNKTTSAAPGAAAADQATLVQQLRLQQLFQQQHQQQQQQQHGTLATVQVRPTSITLPTTTQYAQQQTQQVRILSNNFIQLDLRDLKHYF